VAAKEYQGLSPKVLSVSKLYHFEKF
jgi:hypothetical protein